MKKCICLVLSVMLMLSMTVVGASAAGGDGQIVFTLSANDAAVGETVTLSVSVPENSYFTNAVMYLHYDADKLAYVEGSETTGEAAPTGAWFMVADYPEEGFIKGAYVTVSGARKGGSLVEVSFTVLKEGITAFTLAFDECVGVDPDGEKFDVLYFIDPCNVTLSKKAVSYPDVPKSAWYYDAVMYVSENGIMTGYKSGTFGAVNNLQRQDFVVTIARLAGADLTDYQGQTGGMKDVKASAYYAPAVAWAVDNGIITGYKNGKFGVGEAITREQVATILYRAAGELPVNTAILNRFPDRAKISPYAKNAMAWAVDNGLISGLKSGNISPLTGASRAQIATILMRMMNVDPVM